MRQTVIELGKKIEAMPLDETRMNSLTSNSIFDKENNLVYTVVNNIGNTRWNLDVVDYNRTEADNYFYPCVHFKLDYSEYSYLLGIMTVKYNNYRKFIADKIGFDLNEPIN